MEWKRLTEVLSEEIAIYKELLLLSDEKRKAIYEEDVQKLDAIVRSELSSVTNLNHWEKQRQVCMDAPNAGQTGLASSDNSTPPTLLFYTSIAPPEYSEQLKKLHAELSELLSELQTRNTENKALIDKRLTYVEFVVDALTAEQTAGLYGSGYGNVSPDSGALVSKNITDLKG